MYKKIKSYPKPYRKTIAKPISYKNGFIKTATNLTAFLQGNKLILKSVTDHSDGQNHICTFNVTKNSQILGTSKGVYMPSTKVLQITWKSKKYLLTQFKK
jgi:hypothetical protein